MLVTVLSQTSLAQTFAQRSNFTEQLRQLCCRGNVAVQRSIANDCGSHSHFFILKMQYGTMAAATIATSANG